VDWVSRISDELFKCPPIHDVGSLQRFNDFMGQGLPQELGAFSTVRRKDTLSPAAIEGEHDSFSALPESVIEVVHRVRNDPAVSASAGSVPA
jgi:hypothetical protein